MCPYIIERVQQGEAQLPVYVFHHHTPVGAQAAGSVWSVIGKDDLLDSVTFEVGCRAPLPFASLIPVFMEQETGIHEHVTVYLYEDHRKHDHSGSQEFVVPRPM